MFISRIRRHTAVYGKRSTSHTLRSTDVWGYEKKIACNLPLTVFLS